jgi:hypothetical protein
MPFGMVGLGISRTGGSKRRSARDEDELGHSGILTGPV